MSEGSPQPWQNQIFCEDALLAMRRVPAASLDLVYLDPPFYTRKEHGTTDTHTFSDRWSSRQEYLDWLEARLRALQPLLKPNASFLLHLDWHIVHYAKVLCDSLFGEDAFQNELIWHYQTGGASKGRFSRKHDTILFYATGPDFYFDGPSIAIPRTPKAMKRAHSGKGARIATTDTHKNPEDVLTIPALNPMAKERTGYPTQKPVELLERLITALCPPGGIVADFCCGSGTTLVAAQNMGRMWVGCDISPKATALATTRLSC